MPSFITDKPDVCASWCEDCFLTTTNCINLVNELHYLEQSKLGYEVDQYMLNQFNRNIFDPNDIWRHIIAELGR